MVERLLTFRKVRIEKGKAKVLKDGTISTETVIHHWAPCDRCGEGTYVAEDDLIARWDCPACKRTSNRKVTAEQPMCTGRTHKKVKVTHDPIPMITKDPNPGKLCRMTPRCKGKHRKVQPA